MAAKTISFQFSMKITWETKRKKYMAFDFMKLERSKFFIDKVQQYQNELIVFYLYFYQYQSDFQGFTIEIHLKLFPFCKKNLNLIRVEYFIFSTGNISGWLRILTWLFGLG